MPLLDPSSVYITPALFPRHPVTLFIATNPRHLCNYGRDFYRKIMPLVRDRRVSGYVIAAVTENHIPQLNIYKISVSQLNIVHLYTRVLSRYEREHMLVQGHSALFLAQTNSLVINENGMTPSTNKVNESLAILNFLRPLSSVLIT